MAQETKVKVKLDTTKASAQLKGLIRESARTAGRIAGGVRGAVGRGMGAVGLGAGVGAGMAAIKSSTSSGLGDIIGETTGLLGAKLEKWVFGDMAEKARSAKYAREQTHEAFDAIAGSRGSIPPAAVGFFKSVEAQRAKVESGRQMIERDDRFRGPGVDDLITKITEALNELFHMAADKIIDAICFWR